MVSFVFALLFYESIVFVLQVLRRSVCFLFLLSCILIKSSEDGLKIITQLPRSPLMKYHSYSNVMILHFYIPLDSIEASFKFKAKDDSTSIFGKRFFTILCEYKFL